MISASRSAFLIAVLIACWPGSADAGKLVVLPFEGRGPTGSARMSLVRALTEADDVTLMPQREYVAEVRAAGVAPGALTTPAGVRRGAEVTGVHAVVAGRTVYKNERWHARISYFDSEGTRRLHRDYLLVRGSLRQNDINRIVSYVRQRAAESAPPVAVARQHDGSRDTIPGRAWDDASPPSAATVAGEAPREAAMPPPPPPPPLPPAWQPPAESRSAGDRYGEEISRSDWNTAPGNRTDSRAAGTGKNEISRMRPLLSLMVAAGGANRGYEIQGPYSSMTFQTGNSSMGSGIPMFPEAGILAESFPLNGKGAILGGLGLCAGLGRGFIVSHIRLEDQVEQLSTPLWRMHLDARFRPRLIPSSPFSPEIGVRGGVGYSKFQTAIGNPAFIGVSNMALRVGIEAAQPIVPSRLWLSGWMVAMPVAWPGEAEKAAYGALTKSNGWAARLGISGSVGGVIGSAWIDREVVRSEFEGGGTRDDSGASEESYLAVRAGVGWAF